MRFSQHSCQQWGFFTVARKTSKNSLTTLARSFTRGHLFDRPSPRTGTRRNQPIKCPETVPLLTFKIFPISLKLFPSSLNRCAFARSNILLGRP